MREQTYTREDAEGYGYTIEQTKDSLGRGLWCGSREIRLEQRLTAPTLDGLLGQIRVARPLDGFA